MSSSQFLRSLIIGSFILAAAPLKSQLLIDATAPPSPVTSGIGTGSGGGTGHPLPIRLTLERFGTAHNGSQGRTVVDFVITNIGKAPLTLPTSLDSREVGAAKEYRTLYLHLTSDKRRTQALPIGANSRPYIVLYGTEKRPATLQTLSPGESIRVRSEVAIPQDSSSNTGGATVFVAHADLEDVVVSKRNDRPFLASHELGISSSREFSPQMLLESSK